MKVLNAGTGSFTASMGAPTVFQVDLSQYDHMASQDLSGLRAQANNLTTQFYGDYRADEITVENLNEEGEWVNPYEVHRILDLDSLVTCSDQMEMYMDSHPVMHKSRFMEANNPGDPQLLYEVVTNGVVKTKKGEVTWHITDGDVTTVPGVQKLTKKKKLMVLDSYDFLDSVIATVDGPDDLSDLLIDHEDRLMDEYATAEDEEYADDEEIYDDDFYEEDRGMRTAIY